MNQHLSRSLEDEEEGKNFFFCAQCPLTGHGLDEDQSYSLHPQLEHGQCKNRLESNLLPEVDWSKVQLEYSPNLPLQHPLLITQ